MGAAVGCVGAGPPQVWVGQRVTLLLTLPLALAAWVVLATSHSVWVLVVARAVQGLTLGFVVGPSTNYLVEIAHTNLRGVLFAAVNVAGQLGYFVMYAAGHWDVSWRVAVLVCGCLATILPFFGLIFLPDSPRWLASRDRYPEAIKAMTFFRGPRYDSRQELAGVVEQLDKRKVNLRDQLRQMEKPDVLCYMLLFTFLFMASQFSGSFVTSLYTLQIFGYSKGELSPSLSAVVVSAIRVMGAVFHLIIVEHLSRKFLLVGAFLLCAGTMALLGSSLYDQAHTRDIPLQSWLPLASLATFSFFSNSAISILDLLQEEIMPTSVRSIAVSFLSCFKYVGSFLAIQTYLHVVAGLGQHGVFWLYSFFNFLLALLGGLALRETQGASLEEITAKNQLKAEQADSNFEVPDGDQHVDDPNHNLQGGYKTAHYNYNEMQLAQVPHNSLRRTNGHLKSSPPIIVHHDANRSPHHSYQDPYKPATVVHQAGDTNVSHPLYSPSEDLPYASITDGCVKVFFLNQQYQE